MNYLNNNKGHVHKKAQRLIVVLKQFKVRYLLLLFACYLPIFMPAQQCGYHGYGAIIVNVVDAHTHQPISGLKMYLTYTNGDIINAIDETSENKNQDLPCADECKIR